MAAFGVRCGADSVGHEHQDPTLQVRCPELVSAAGSVSCLQLLNPESPSSCPCAPAKQSEACLWPFCIPAWLVCPRSRSSAVELYVKDASSLRQLLLAQAFAEAVQQILRRHSRALQELPGSVAARREAEADSSLSRFLGSVGAQTCPSAGQTPMTALEVVAHTQHLQVSPEHRFTASTL